MSTGFSNLAAPMREDVVEVPGARVDQVCMPSCVEQVSEIITQAAAEKAGLLILGGRTRLSIANRARPLQLGLCLSSYSGIDEFEPDEGVLHAKAGTKIADVREAVRKEGWELPLDSPGPHATVGGTIASAVTGPRSQAFGSVSDAILGLEVVTGDGVASKCGGRVVKNVTGYDLAKLYCGSFGSLAVVTGAWLRLRPVASVCHAYRLTLPTNRDGFEVIRRLARLTSVRALIWSEAPGRDRATLLLELGGSAEGVEHDRSRFERTLASSFPDMVPSELALDEVGSKETDDARDARSAIATVDEPIALRVRVLGTRCEAMREVLLSAGLRVSIDLGLAVLHARGSVATPASLAAIRAQAEAAGGLATFEQMPDAWRSELDAFGTLGGTEGLIATLKSKLDPAHVLNPGRFVAETQRGISS